MDERIIQNDPLQTLKNYNGHYQCPSHNGILSGYIVAYAGDYQDADGTRKQFVGEDYFNVATVETQTEVRQYFAQLMTQNIINRGFDYPDKVVGMPMGGIKFSQAFGDIFYIPSIFAEKKILEIGDPQKGTKDKSKLIIARHEIHQGEEIFIIEDLCNNFTTTQKAIEVIESFGAKVTGIACVVNRSNLTEYNGIPIFSAIHKPSPQYQQDDPKVAELVRAGKVIWNAKHFWSELKKTQNV